MITKLKATKLKATKVREVIDSGDLVSPGDICIRSLPLYNSATVIRAVVLKCPYCGADMASVYIHRIFYSKLSRILSRMGLPFGITVKPKLVCPYYPLEHSFSITRGRIAPAK